jgi:hypothetical protein
MVPAPLTQSQQSANAEDTNKATEPEQRRMPDVPINSAPRQDSVQYHLKDDARQENQEKAGYECVEYGNFTRHNVFLL